MGGSKQLPNEPGVTYEADPENEEGIIEVDENGKVTGVGEGTAKILVTSDGSGNYKATREPLVITVTVTGTPQTGDTTLRWVATGVLALVVMAAYLFFTKKKESK